ncbi:MAG: uracil-DNA glycosylase, partial [Porticoccaceae bacterium]
MANMLPLLLDRIHRRIYQMNITDQAKIQLSPNWLKALEGEFSKPYWHTLSQYLMEQEQGGKTIYPPGEQLFSAFYHTDLENVRVVIIGQDPYHGLDQANGLCFSVAPGNKIPP